MNAWGFKDFAVVISSAVSIITVVLSVFYGGQWIGSLETRVRAVESRADFTADVASIKTQMGLLDRQLDRMESKIDRLPRT